MKQVYFFCLSWLMASPLLAQQPVTAQKVPITRWEKGALLTENEPLDAVLKRLSQEPAIQGYHPELKMLNAALASAKPDSIRRALAPIQARLQQEGPQKRVQLSSFVRGLDSVLSLKPVVVATPEATSEESKEAETATSPEPSPAVVFPTKWSTNPLILIVGVAVLLTLILALLYGVARRQIKRLRFRERDALTRNDQLLNTLRRQVQSQHEEIKGLREEAATLRQAAGRSWRTPTVGEEPVEQL